MSALQDALVVAATSAGCSLVVAGLGLAALGRLRHRSLPASAAVVVAVALGSVIASVLGTASLMFLSRHDMLVLVAVVAISAPVSLAVALLLARRLARDSRSLGMAVSSFGEVPYSTSTSPLGAELAALDGQLAAADARLQESLGRERSLEAGRRDTVAWISHDLRTPLAGIRAMSEALVDGVVPDRPTVERYHRDIHTQAERLSSMVDDLFELARINAGALRLRLDPVGLAEVVSEALVTASPVAAARQVRLVAAPPEQALDVLASGPELGRVLGNVLANAVRHTPAGGTVRVQTRRTAERVVVEVSDGCGGIAEHELPRLFEVGYRGTAARTPDGGAGLGLAIARGLVEAQGGDISVANEGPGCRVTVGLMAVPDPQPVAQQAAARVGTTL